MDEDTDRILESLDYNPETALEAEQQIAKSRGEAEALRMQREQVTPNLIELRKVEAQLKAIEKWNGVLPGYVGAGVPFISIDKK